MRSFVLFFYLVVSVPLWGTSLLEKKPILEEEQQERIFEDSEDRFMDNNITRATTGLHAESLASEESLLDPLASETATGNFQGISITQEEPTIETLDHLSTSALKQESKEVMGTRESPLMRVAENYNRVSLIDKKVKTYEEKLKDLKASTVADPTGILSNRSLVLESLITVLQVASDYQKKMINHLKETASSQDERKAPLRKSHLLANLLKINEAPNKIERVAEQIENNAYAIERTQKLILALEKVEAQIPGLPANNPVTLDPLAPRRACDRLKKFITFQQALISKRVLYGTSLCPPYQKLEEETQEAIQKNKENCLQKETEARKEGVLASYELSPNVFQQMARNEAVEEAQKPDFNPEVIEWYTKSADLSQQALTAEDLGQQQKKIILGDAGHALFQKAEEAQKPHPNPEVIAWYTKSAELYQQAARAADFGQEQKARFLRNAGNALFQKAEEAQKPHPNPEVIEWYAKSADLGQQAARAADFRQEQKAVCLNNVGYALFELAKEAQKPDPNAGVIAWYTKSAELYQQAARAADFGQEQKAICLRNAGYALFQKAEEAQKPHPNPEVSEWFTKSENLYQQAVTAENLGQQEKARFLGSAGDALFELAQEAQKTDPNPEVIEWYTKSADLHQQAARAEDLGQQQKAIFLRNAGYALFQKAQEAQKPDFNPEVIEWFTKSENLYQQAARAEDLSQQQEAIFLDNAGYALFYVAKEVQKPHPNQDVINQYLKEAQENMDKAYNDA